MENSSKRQFRQLSDETKAKISAKLKNRTKSFSHKENIINSLKKLLAENPK